MEETTFTIEALSEQYKCKVIQFTLNNEGEEPATGYLRTPNIDMKLRLLDSISNGNAATVASQILEGHLCKESDSRITKTNEDYWLGAVTIVIKTVRAASGEIKKN